MSGRFERLEKKGRIKDGAEDIRDKASLCHNDVIGLNFIKASGPHVFRRHFRQGLRSHIMEILKRADVAIENNGTMIDGTRWFPRARPTYMLRIFRTKLTSLESALAEIRRVKVIERYLGPDFIAESSEFLVDYHGPDGPAIMLCGFQAYVPGEILDPWTLLDGERLIGSLYANLQRRDACLGARQTEWIATARRKADRFVGQIKQMIKAVRYVPDLAGAGNLVLNREGQIRLVDINNISPVAFNDTILLDDKGYPVCDKSIEALSLIERKVLDRPIDFQDPFYRFFLDPERKRRVGLEEARFYRGRAGQ